MVCGADAAGRGPAAYGRGNIAAIYRPDIPAGIGGGAGLARRGPPGRFLLLHLLNQGLDPGLDLLLLFGEVVQGVFLLLLLLAELCHQGVGRVPLGIQVPLLGLQLRLGLLRGGFLPLQFRFLFGGKGLQDFQIVNDPLVILHDLVHHVQAAQEIRKAVGPEQHGPVLHLPLLLHSPDPLAEKLILGRFPGLRVRQLRRRLGNQILIGGNFLFLVADLLLCYADLAVQEALALHGSADVGGQLVNLGLDILFLLSQALGVAFQRVDVRLGHRRSGGSQVRQKQAQRQGQKRQGPEEKPSAISFHAALLRPVSTSEWRKGCPPRR